MSFERSPCFETERTMTLQGHPRSLILAPIESAHMTSYSTSIVILPHFRDIRAFVRQNPFCRTLPHSGENFGVFPLE